MEGLLRASIGLTYIVGLVEDSHSLRTLPVFKVGLHKRHLDEPLWD